MFDVNKIRKDFPILKRKVNGHDLVYLDNASSSQKPNIVINEIKNVYQKHYSNIHRGLHELSSESSELFEKSREYISNFFSAESEELVFVKNATEGLNLVANSFNFKKGDEVIVSNMEHHANIVPWYLLKERLGIKLKVMKFNNKGLLDLETLKNSLTKRTKIVSLVHASNALGSINPIKELCKTVKNYSEKIIFGTDLAQSSPHLKTSFKDLGVDFGVFSSHKMLGPSGVGGLLIKEGLAEDLNPYQGGGSMIKSVSFDKISFAKTPQKFEAGTPPIEAVIGFKAALVYLTRLGMGNVRVHEKELLSCLFKGLKNFSEIDYYGPREISKRTGLVSFNIKGIHSHDVSELLNQYGVATRSGHHCAQPLHNFLGIDSSTRASFYVYNTKKEVEILLDSIGKVIEIFKVK